MAMNEIGYFVSSPTTNEVTPTANFELVDKDLFPDHFTSHFYKSLSFVNFSDCTVTINDKSTVTLMANVGINIENMYIYSFKVHEENISFYFLANF